MSITDTPNRRLDVPETAFGAMAPYTEADHIGLMLAVLRTAEVANLYRAEDCTETHWMSVVVHPLLTIVHGLKKFRTSSGIPLLRSDDMAYVRMQKSLTPSSHDDYFTGLKKRIDGAFGLRLSEEEIDILESRCYTSPGLPSINPAENFTQLVPQFLLIELKRPNTNKDALIQLGLWASVEFTKRRIEGWGMDMQILAVQIEGDEWQLWEAYATSRGISKEGEHDFGVVFVGPQYMGTTRDLYGIFQILEWLCRCAEWGLREYKEWVKAEMLQPE
ncbi:hypothetical protein JMJ35_006409 [Cladonia borealis]|uniref:PD-(D/E)XK nuclease-like domain-containing protein n=1 Tax=Cladonia borealis TaxID=184061 RepID=A0AA39QX44_9LECA|nr:hypothetical protein JMJ35_006409 [Cladonia borealis]